MDGPLGEGVSLGFVDTFDQALAEQGPPAVFGLTADGELRLQPDRSREAWDGRVSAELALQPCHCLYRDRATGFVQYLLVTSPALCADHPRADIWRYASEPEALAALARAGRPAVWRGERL